jgi:[ribosomal protein S18]-alanine N-acetyltransferase
MQTNFISYMTENVFNQVTPMTMKDRFEITNFLHNELEGHGNSKEHITNAIEYAMNTNPMAGGFILQLKDENITTGVVVMNKTGMQGYFPENILVYIVVHRDFQGKGLEERMVKRAMQLSKGDIALQVEQDHPAGYLYKKMGFVNLHSEMRYYQHNAPENN